MPSSETIFDVKEQDSNNEHTGNMVMVRSLNDGGLYALEIEPDRNLAVVSKNAQEWVKQQEEIDEEGVESMNVLLRSRDFIGSTDAGGNHLKLKEPKLQALTTPKLSQPSPGTSVGKKAQIAAGGSSSSESIISGKTCRDVAPQWRKELCLVGGHKLKTWERRFQELCPLLHLHYLTAKQLHRSIVQRNSINFCNLSKRRK